MSCNTPLKNLPKIFESVSNYLEPKDRDFYSIDLTDPSSGADILLDNSFGNITFKFFLGRGIKKIETNAFKNIAHKLIQFNCDSLCSLVNEPPKYDLQNVFNQMSSLYIMYLTLNVNELPNFALNISQPSHLTFINIKSDKKLTVKSGAFQNFDKLKSLTFSGTPLKFEKEAFKSKNSTALKVKFENIVFIGIYMMIKIN